MLKRISAARRAWLLLQAVAMGALLGEAAWAGAGQVAPRATQPSEGRAVRVEPSQQLFAALCALHAAGFGANVSSPEATSLEVALRDQLLGMHGPAVEALRDFYREHTLGTPSETLSRYISFALVAGPAPQFELQFSREDLPPDVLGIEGFGELLGKFWREQRLDQVWAQVQPLYEKESARLRGPVTQLVAVTAGYLREVVPGDGVRTFRVYVDPLVGGATNSRFYRDQYTIVVGAGANPPLDSIRHAFLHFLLDPLPLHYAEATLGKSALLAEAARAPRLPHIYQTDFTALLTECLVRAVDLRLRRLPAGQLDAAVSQAERDGYVLVRPILHQLERFDQAAPSMTRFYPELVQGINVDEETRRLEQVKFAAATEGGDTTDSPAGEATAASELDRLLEQGDRQIASQDPAGAIATFQHILQMFPDTPRALYGLAVASALSRQGEMARELFERLVAPPAPGGRPATNDPVILAWSHVYLGRMRDVDGERDLAVAQYRAALAVEGAPESARLAAQRGLQHGYKLPAKAREQAQPRP